LDKYFRFTETFYKCLILAYPAARRDNTIISVLLWQSALTWRRSNITPDYDIITEDGSRGVVQQVLEILNVRVG